MIREIFIIFLVVIAFVTVSWLTDAPDYVAMLAALIVGMWADLSIEKRGA